MFRSPRAARWVASEQWHPAQAGRELDNGGYEFHIPYSDPTELIGDILRYGPEAEVIAPEDLRQTIADRIGQMNRRYSK